MSTNFQLKRLKLKLDIVEKPENRVHKLTDSNVSRSMVAQSLDIFTTFSIKILSHRILYVVMSRQLHLAYCSS